MMYLTRFRINPARRGARKLLSSPQAMHAAVLASFPDPVTLGGNRGRVLWRVDAGHTGNRTLYLVSPVEPDLTHLVEQAGWPTTESWQVRPYAPFLYSLQKGQVWAFRLTANPSRSGKQPGRQGTQRFGHVTVAQQQQWLLDRAERAGFRIVADQAGEVDVAVQGRDTHTFQRDGRRVTLRVATFEGRLEVADPETLRATLTKGLGHAKAYGCGLVTLAHAR